MFLGTTFAGCPEASYGSAESEGTITSLTLKNMVLDEIYSTKQVLINFNWEIIINPIQNKHIKKNISLKHKLFN